MVEKESPDKDLILSFQQTQSNIIFEVIYDRYASFVYRKCLLMTGSEADAQDLTQEIWIKIYFALDTFRFESKFSTWVSRITINRCINHFKRTEKLIFSEDNELPRSRAARYQKEFSFNPDAEHRGILLIKEKENGSLPNINNCLDVTKLLSRLSIETKALLMLKYLDELSYEEIADITGIGVSAVKMKISRAKKELIRYSTGTNSKNL